MKQQRIGLMGVLAVVLALAVAPAFSQEKSGKMTHTMTMPSKASEETIRGEVIDLWCYLDNGDHGASHKQCGVACAKGGNPIGILDAKGNVFVALGSKAHEFDRDALINRMADTVTVTGRVVKKGGMQVLYIASIK